MSERLGPVAFGRKQQMVFLGRDLGEQRDYSEHVGELIDDEIRRFLDEGFARASAILRAHRDVLERLAQALIGQETLDAAALERVFGGPAQQSWPAPERRGTCRKRVATRTRTSPRSRQWKTRVRRRSNRGSPRERRRTLNAVRKQGDRRLRRRQVLTQGPARCWCHLLIPRDRLQPSCRADAERDRRGEALWLMFASRRPVRPRLQ